MSGPIKILLLEDSDIDADLLSGHLSKSRTDATIHRAVDRAGYVEALAAGGFDVILADFSLPDFDGLSALQIAKKQAPDLPFIFVSGVIGEEFAANALREGATDYVLKRNISRVATSIDRALAEAKQRRDRKAAEDELHRREEELRIALSAGKFGTWTLDLRSEEFKTSEVCRTNFGRDPASPFTYADLLEAVHPDDRARMRAAVERSIADQEDYDIEYRIITPADEIRWVSVRGRATYGDDGTPRTMAGVSGDITQRKWMEEELRQVNETLEQRVIERTNQLMEAQEALRQSQKMEAIGQLTGGIAHDFNNMLTGITGSLTLLKRRLDTGRVDDVDRFMSGAMVSADRAAGLTHRLLAFARRQALHTEAQDVNHLVAGMVDLFRRTLGESIELKVNLPADTWRAMADANQLENALLNLAINARDAMPAGGELIVETGHVTLDVAAADRQGVAPGDYVVVAVTDTGTGMTPDVLEKAFDPFFTTKPIGQGTGLGLSMIYGFARQSGGYATLSSKVGTGTTVRIALPRSRDAVADTASSSAPLVESVNRETILVVEDEPIVRMLITEVLDELGYQFVDVDTAAKAIQILESKEQIDLLVTDVGLPNMNGRQLAEAARTMRPGLKVLFVTGYADLKPSQDLFGPGMDMMSKPFELGALSAKIRDLIELEIR